MSVPDRSQLPLAELHCHLEGTVPPDLALRLGRRHGHDLSRLLDADGAWAWTSFIDFLNVYDAMSEVIQTPQDHFDVTRTYFENCAEVGMRYGEIFVSPAHAERHGIPYTALIEGVAAGLEAAEHSHGIHGRIILTCVRHYGVPHAETTARLAEHHPHPHVVGFGMAGDEAHGRPRDYARAFEIARGAGLHTTAHAGEMMGAESVRETLDFLKVERIGHGVRSLESPPLVEELADRRIPLEICPGSNIAMKVFDSLEEHPLRHYFDTGVVVTLSTDDPAFFHTDIRREYVQAAAVHGFTRRELLSLTRNSIHAAFCSEALKVQLFEDLDDWERSGADGT